MIGFYDPMTAEALIQRYPVNASRNDLIGAVHILTGQGWSKERICQRLRISDRTVQRYRLIEIEPEPEVVATYCACPAHEYASKTAYYNRDRKECTA